MAITLALAKTTPYSLQYRLVHDGAAGDTVIVSRAQMQGDVLAGPLKELIDSAENPNSTALARAHGLGDASALASQDLTNFPHCEAFVQGRTGVVTWIVDADIDGGMFEYNILTSSGVAGTALLVINFRHSYDR